MHTKTALGAVLALVFLIAAPMPATAAKCRNGKSTLYTQDRYCPSGYTDVTSAMGGSVSTVGKSDNVRKAEQEFLGMRAEEDQQYRNQQARQQAQFVQEQNQMQAECAAIDGQIRTNEIQQRQINAWQQMEQLKQAHRALRDQRYRLGCHR